MTITDATNKVTHTADGSTTAFAFTFPIVDTSDLKVVERVTSTGVETVMTETTHYTVSAPNNDYSSGGTVTAVTAPASGRTWTIIRDMPANQEATLEDSGVLRLAAIEDALDKLTMIVQDLEERVGRCLQFPRSETTSAELEDSVTRASTTLGFDSSGDLSYS